MWEIREGLISTPHYSLGMETFLPANLWIFFSEFQPLDIAPTISIVPGSQFPACYCFLICLWCRLPTASWNSLLASGCTKSECPLTPDGSTYVFLGKGISQWPGAIMDLIRSYPIAVLHPETMVSMSLYPHSIVR